MKITPDMLKAVLGGKLTEEMLASFDFKENGDLWKKERTLSYTWIQSSCHTSLEIF